MAQHPHTHAFSMPGRSRDTHINSKKHFSPHVDKTYDLAECLFSGSGCFYTDNYFRNPLPGSVEGCKFSQTRDPGFVQPDRCWRRLLTHMGVIGEANARLSCEAG